MATYSQVAMRFWLTGMAVYCVAGAANALAQASVEVHGIVFDSLRMRPLASATVGVLGAGSATTDARGRFRIAGVSPGERTIVVAHAMFDTVGLSGLTRRVTIATGREKVTLAVPSFATFWTVACGAGTPTRDLGVVYGSIRDSDGAPVPAARVEMTWVETSVEKKKQIRQHRLRTETVTDSTGSYGACGVPAATAIRIQATHDRSTSGDIDLFPTDLRVVRQDLVVASPDADKRGIIAGALSDPAGMPVRDARILVDDLPEVRSGDDGRFVLRDVPAGTRQVEVLSIGMLPVSATVDVRVGDTATVALQLAKVTTLAVVNVTASARARRFIADFEERRLKGMGYVRDSLAFAGAGTLAAVFSGFPSLGVHAGRTSAALLLTFSTPPRGRPNDPMDGKCLAALWIDRIPQRDYARFSTLQPDEIAAIEVYPRRFTVPMEFSGGFGCGAVIVWTKYAFR